MSLNESVVRKKEKNIEKLITNWKMMIKQIILEMEDLERES
jgi:hypothetical protein